MAYSRRKTKKDGTIFYEITATKNRNEKVSKSWTPPPGWSQKSIERQLHKEEAEFQRQFDAGEILTVAEKKEKERLEALERAKLVTFKDFCESVYLPEIILNQKENTRISYENALKNWVYPEFGEMKLVDINGAMIRALLTKMQTAGRGVSSRRIALTIIRGVLARAVESGLICDNCAAGVPLTKSKAEKTAAKSREKVSLLRLMFRRSSPISTKTNRCTGEHFFMPCLTPAAAAVSWSRFAGLTSTLAAGELW